MAPETDRRHTSARLTSPADYELPDLRPVVGRSVRLPERRLRTAYYDTSDRRLFEQGLTLHHAIDESGGDARWTLSAADSSDCPEGGEWSWAGPRDEVPGAVTAVLSGLLRRAELRMTAELLVTRRPFALRDERDQPIGALDDDIVTVVGGQHDGYRFRQIDIDAGDGLDAAVLVRHLERAGAPSTEASAFARALALESSGHPPTPGRTSSVLALVRGTLARDYGRLVGRDWRLRLSLEDPDAEDVHQARVATRRLRAGLKTFGPVLDPVWVRHTRQELSWVGDALGAVRDLDVLERNLAALPLDSPEDGRRLRERLEVDRARAVSALGDALRATRYLDILDRLHAAIARPPIFRVSPDSPARELAPQLVASRWRSLRRRVRDGGATPSDADLHRIRIGAKGFRYACEAVAPVIGKPARRTARKAEMLQEALGEHHDAVEAERWLRTHFRDGVTDFSAGWLAAEQRQRQDDVQGRWPAQWKSLVKKRARRWLRPTKERIRGAGSGLARRG